MKPYCAGNNCPKCSAVATTHYERERITDREVMRRHCVRCGYSWAEAPLDAKPENPLGAIRWESLRGKVLP